MRKTLFFLILIVMSVLLISCADKEQEADEIIKYYNEEWIPINEEVISQLEKVNPKNKKMNNLQLKSEEFALDSFNNIIKYYEGVMTESELANDKQKLDSM